MKHWKGDNMKHGNRAWKWGYLVERTYAEVSGYFSWRLRLQSSCVEVAELAELQLIDYIVRRELNLVQWRPLPTHILEDAWRRRTINSNSLKSRRLLRRCTPKFQTGTRTGNETQGSKPEFKSLIFKLNLHKSRRLMLNWIRWHSYDGCEIINNNYYRSRIIN